MHYPRGPDTYHPKMKDHQAIQDE